MTDTSSNNKRIAKNTMLLYFRMFFSMCVSLYTSRVVLQTLGVEDFGIYNVVGGVIALFGFITSSMSSAVSRFLSFELGRANIKQLTKTFSSSLILHLGIAVLICVLTETIGLWFLKTKLVIPLDRLYAALWVFHISVITTFCSIIKVPFVAVVYSHERMGVYAFIEILAVIFKLLLVISLSYISFDKLILYSLFILFIEFMSVSLYSIYDLITFKECKLKVSFDRKVIRPIISFSGWDFYGNMSVVARTQGVNMLLNVFFGPILNAAAGIASQIQGAVTAFSGNILVAVRPQIVKSFAQNEIDYTLTLLRNTTKLTSILLLIIITPLAVEMEYVLKLWLGEYPEYTVILSQLTLLFVLLANISSVIMSVIHATGRVKKSSLLNGTLYLSVIPISYFAFKYKLSPVTPFLLNAIFVFVGAVCNMIYLSHYIYKFSWIKFIKDTILPMCVIGFLGFSILYSATFFLIESVWRVLFISFFSVLLYSGVTWLFLLDKHVKQKVITKIKVLF